MTCREIVGLLPAHIDERLPQDDLAIVRGHLAACEPCARERAALERTDGLLGAALSDHPWHDAGLESLVLGLRTRVRAQVTGPRTHTRGPSSGSGLWIAAAAVLLVAGGLAWRAGPETVTPGPGDVAAGPRTLARAGEGLMRAGEGGAFSALSVGDVVHAGERLVAIAPGAHVILEDETRVELYPDTEIALTDDADGGVTVAMGGLDGEVYCEVSKRKRPFRVAARGLEVSVVGTRFLVNHGARVSRVVVLEGRVLASTQSDRRSLVADDAVEAREGEQELHASRVTAPVWGLWVPRVADELKQRFAGTPTTTAPAPTEPSPLAPTPPSPPVTDLDTPVLPPGEKQPR